MCSVSVFDCSGCFIVFWVYCFVLFFLACLVSVLGVLGV